MSSVLAQKQTPLHGNHVNRQAKMVDFSGWDMPLQFGKVIEEHHAVRNAAGLFDISHMGLVTVTGPDRDTVRQFLDTLVPQNLQKLVPGKAIYTQFLNEAGGIIDDLIVYELPEQSPFDEFEQFMVICNAGNTDTDIAWMKRHAPDNVSVHFVSNRYSLVALQGPKFQQVLAECGLNAEQLPKRFWINAAELALPGSNTPESVLLARTGYTGEDGVEIIVKSQAVNHLWDGLLNAGQALGIYPVGLAARDTLRLEAALPLHGHDISENDSPLEADLAWSVKMEKPTPFIGQEALRTQLDKGLAKKLVCFQLVKKTIPRQHDTILLNGEPVGEVTSGSISPILNLPIGMGYINASVSAKPGDIIQIDIRNKPVDAEIVEKPFYKKA
ncbi:MAG: glycine cleavage system aminomethyltransferase GcvT [Vampirovibrio sp.]|nr:glycine cleavage system aminomethyltransferase GcvT [Vampirovibrio sp.]